MEQLNRSDVPSKSVPPSALPLLQAAADTGHDSLSSSTDHKPAKGHSLNSRSHKFNLLKDPWLLEWSAIALCIASFASLIIILIRFDGKLLSEWKWATISINTMTSILAAISRTALAAAVSACIAQFKWNWFNRHEAPLMDFQRIDDASRDPWGSFRLIRTTIHHPHWIVLGAVAMIIFPAYGPFLQALINLDSETFIQTENNAWTLLSSIKPDGQYATASMGAAKVGRCLDLDVGSYNQNAGTSAFGLFPLPDGQKKQWQVWGYDARADFGMTAAIWNGLSDLVNPNNFLPTYTCTTGNCTWNTYTSLAACTKCNDVSSLLVKESGYTQLVGDYVRVGKNYTLAANATRPEITYRWPQQYLKLNTSFTKYTLPDSGLNISNYDSPSRCTTRGSTCPDTYMVARYTTNLGMTITFKDLRTLVFSLHIIRVNDSWKTNKTFWEDSKVTAQECSLSFCVAAYDSKIDQGNLYETRHTWNNRTLSTFKTNRSFDDEYTEYRNYALDLPSVDRSDLQLFVPSEAAVNLTKYQGHTKFNISQSTIARMIDVFSKGFGAGDYGNDDPDGTVSSMIYPALEWISPPDFAYSFGASEDTNATFQNLASSLSKWMRDQASTDSAMPGFTMQSMIVIRVFWPYLILPCVTILVGLLVVFLSILDTKRNGLPAWKTETLLSLGHGIEDGLFQKLSTTPRGEIDNVAREEKALLRDRDGQRKLGMSKGYDV